MVALACTEKAHGLIWEAADAVATLAVGSQLNSFAASMCRFRSQSRNLTVGR